MSISSAIGTLAQNPSQFYADSYLYTLISTTYFIALFKLSVLLEQWFTSYFNINPVIQTWNRGIVNICEQFQCEIITVKTPYVSIRLGAKEWIIN